MQTTSTMTFLAQTTCDRIQLPPALAEQVRTAGWLDILVALEADHESLTAYPLPHPNAPRTHGHTTQLDPNGGIHISEDFRQRARLDGQSVMVRFEGDVIRIYLRHVFKTLGFRPA
jgi:hypothetical protein